MNHSKTLKEYKKERKALADARFVHTLSVITSSVNPRQITENKRFLVKCDKRIAIIDTKIAEIKAFIADMKRGRA